MDHYLDIRLRPDPDFASIDLLGALMAKLHRALVRRGSGDIGISFPGLKGKYLGELVRLHGTSAALQSLMSDDWLTGMRDHVDLAPVAAVPLTASHRVVRRVQAKSSPERLRRRRMKRHGLNEEQAKERIPDSVQETLALPYVQLRSTSTGQRFPLFIEHGHARADAQPGHFSTYGLSDGATVPWF